MKKALYMMLYMAVVLFVLTACDRNAHDNERGLTTTLDMSACPNEEIRDVTVWLFGEDNRLNQTFAYSSAEGLASALPEVAKGRYTLVAATNLEKRFTYDATEKNTAAHDLRLDYTAASATNANMHYGIQEVEIAASGITHSVIPMTGVLVHFTLSVKGLRGYINSVKAEIQNVSTGFYPCTGQLTETTKTLTLGTVTAQDTHSTATTEVAETSRWTATFPSVRLMPTVGKAVLLLTFNYGNGMERAVDVSFGSLSMGGEYRAELNYNDDNPEIRLDIVSVSGWEDGGIIGEGEATEN